MNWKVNMSKGFKKFLCQNLKTKPSGNTNLGEKIVQLMK